MAIPEIERKFLLRQMPSDLDLSMGVRILQGYLCLEPGREIRIRSMARQYTMTIKEGQGLVRRETEIALDPKQFEDLWQCTLGRRIDKMRYDYPWQGYTLSIDLYRDALEGLNVVEVEFASEAASAAFQAPSFAGDDITAIGDYFHLEQVLQRRDQAASPDADGVFTAA